jgi:hypothetical protein
MKTTPSFIFLVLISQICFSQLKYGLQGGLNFDSSGDIKLVGEQLQKEGELKSNSGFHLGGYAQADFLIFYLRPELQYTKVSSKFEGNTIENTRIELPVSIGVTVIGPVSMFIGPTAFYNLSHKSDELSFEEVKKKTSYGMHIGTRVQLGPIGVDLRYEKGISTVERKILSEAGVPLNGQVNTQPNQFIIGLSFKLN